MNDAYHQFMAWVGLGFDTVGVIVIGVGAVLATWRVLRLQSARPAARYRSYRQDLGGAIVLGLEFLVAGDIIRSVVVAPTLQNVTVLGLIVVIRTFLSLALQWELHGRWPWQTAQGATSAIAAETGND